MIFPASHWLRVLLHLSAMSLFTVSLASGMRLAADGDWPLQQYWTAIAPQGDMISWHLGSALGWLAVSLTVLFAWIKKRAEVAQTRPKEWLIRALYLTLPVQLLSGAVFYLGIGVGVLDWVLAIHYWGALALLILVVAHLTEQLALRGGRFLPAVFIPRKFTQGLGLLALSCAAGAALWWGGGADSQELVVAPLAEKVRIQIDGAPDEAAWADAEPVTVTTYQGNDYHTAIPVEVRALANPYTVYFSISWPDAHADYSHLPLQKTESGWKALHAGFEKDDERVYYEDKLAVMLSQGGGFGGDNSIHLGGRPLQGYPASRSGRGYHYTTDGSIRDVWHWKAVRGGDMAVLDDDHFGKPEAACAFCPRYKAGYQPDPVEDGGVRQNWDWFRTGGVTPLRIPREGPGVTVAENAMTWYGSRTYRAERDETPVGGSLPSVLWMSHYEGDRGDVRGRAQWKDGRWYLELARARETGSPFDIPIEDGVFMWVAPFDHAQTRHAYHHRPIRLRVRP
ncbi:ethylbenzene dehydrogenase-related protein [Hahella aquimaris]|uniref:ethylbenzene dehydrogenase-related protein n=1 Tax=Hahella sp. HNIBRBA332 TaxID=3015983 RepID=UPI00273B3909|nr:ethylbenzene dehydrogenase-related protein [Hahella sp. HNIBRBA332]WLQ16069.1 ethylbenzene dehydrogenase-related protein [Hahella sp. HNIBRBA332]